MPWKKTLNSAQVASDWSQFVKKESNCTPESARRIAFMDPKITFYFICRDSMMLNGHESFRSGDAVFFTGEPRLCHASEADTYIKCGIVLAYINPSSSQKLREIGSHTLDTGDAAVDVVIIFAANYCESTKPFLRANNNQPPTDLPLNENIQAVFDDGSIEYLQSKGIVVLLCILNGHTSVGWSQFTDQQTAQSFVDYLQEDVIQPYGLDGIDIDDEYSKGVPNPISLIMVSRLYKQKMPNKLLTKALYDDKDTFQTNWEGHKFVNHLDYGWEMGYNSGPPKSRLSFYNEQGMDKKSLVLGFSAESAKQDFWGLVPLDMQEVVKDGWGGGMLFNYENTTVYQDSPVGVTLLGHIVTALMGDGTFNKSL